MGTRKTIDLESDSLILSSEYLAIAPHRMAALDDSRLIASNTRATAFH